MKLSYYPGCSLEGTAREYDESTRAVCRRLGVELVDLPDWNCCGANEAVAVDEDLGLGLAVRNLAIAEREGRELLIPCVGCYARLRWARHAVSENPSKGGPYGFRGKADLLFLVDLFHRDEVLARVREGVRHPLKGLKVASYYGCVMVRPPSRTGARDHENPQALDRLAGILGAEPVDWPRKTDCCGSVMGIARPDVSKSLVGRLLDTAAEAGANALMVACPLCHANVDNRQEEIVSEGLGKTQMPVFYFTELAGLAMGLPEAAAWWDMHMTDPRPLLSGCGLL